MRKIKYYGKLMDELKLGTKEDHIERMPIVLTENDIPYMSDIFNFLNNKDKDILYLIFISGKSQTDLVRILHRSQPSLSYDIKRIKQRVRFICYLHSQFHVFMEWLRNRSSIFSPEEVMILTLMYYTTSFSQSSRVSQFKPTRIRYVFDKALVRLESEDKEMFEFFSNIRDNLNVIRRVYLRAGYYWE